ncbi:MAG: GNAT family N-acetyltransferase [Acidimicrobiia bacterium]
MTAPTPCIFCAIAAGEAEASVVFSDDHTVAFMALHPIHPGHVLVVPRQHCVGVTDAPADAWSAVTATAQRVAAAVVAADPRAEGVTVFTNDGEAAGQDVFHLHVHVLPRWHGDAYRTPMVTPEAPRHELDAIAARIRACQENASADASSARSQVVVGDLADHPGLVTTIAAWHWHEWGGGHPEASEPEWAAALATRCERDAARNLGVGTALVRAAEEKARRIGITELWCHTAEASRFYERCGWTVVRPKHGLNGDAVLMRRV